jgi:UDP-N-acetylmuramoyl-tripeptide--D-alanyl-D-alanine ligase
MAELGNQSGQLHAELGAAIAKAGVQFLIAVGKFAKIVAETARKTASYDLQAECFEDTISVCNRLQELVKDNDIILVKGSRTARLEIVTEKLKELRI